MNKLKDVLFDYNNFCGYAVDALKRQETGDYDEEGALDDDGDNTTAFFYYSKVAQNEPDLPIHKHLKGYTTNNQKLVENPRSSTASYRFAECPIEMTGMPKSLSDKLHVKRAK